MTEKQTADLDMIASGALSPLNGFMVQADYDRGGRGHAPRERPAVGAPGHAVGAGGADRRDRLALEGSEGDLLAVIDVADVFEADRENEAAKVFRTTEDAHPGVAQVYAEGTTCSSAAR